MGDGRMRRSFHLLDGMEHLNIMQMDMPVQPQARISLPVCVC